MAIKYIDLYNGDDANNGDSWATAWKTITNGATAARIFPGDEIRISKTPDPVYVFDALWNFGVNGFIRIPKGHVAFIENCETNWTPISPNLSVLSTMYRRQGSYGVQLTVNRNFVLGKIAYKTLSTPMNLSDFQILSFNWGSNTQIFANSLRVVLCSDNLGDVPVDSFIITDPNPNFSGALVPLALHRVGGGNLGNNINSIAIYADANTSNTSIDALVYLDQFIACKNNNVNLTSLIGINPAPQQVEDFWMTVMAINPFDEYDQISFDFSVKIITVAGYHKTFPDPVPTYIRDSYFSGVFPANTGAVNNLNRTGTPDNYIKYEGGFEVGTENQNGMTFFDSRVSQGYTFYASGKAYLSLNFFGIVRSNSAIRFSEIHNFIITNIQISNGYEGIGLVSAYRTLMKNCLAPYLNAAMIYMSGSHNNTAVNIKVDRSGNYMFDFVSSFNNKIINVTSQGHTGYHARSTHSLNCCFINAVFSRSPSLVIQGNFSLAWLWLYNLEGIEGNHIGYSADASSSVRWQTAECYQDNPGAWQVAHIGVNWTNYPNPIIFTLAEIAFQAQKEVTIQVMVKSTNPNTVPKFLGILVEENLYLGIQRQLIYSTNTTDWQQLTLTFTPEKAGVIEVFCISETANSTIGRFIGPISVTQAD